MTQHQQSQQSPPNHCKLTKEELEELNRSPDLNMTMEELAAGALAEQIEESSQQEKSSQSNTIPASFQEAFTNI